MAEGEGERSKRNLFMGVESLMIPEAGIMPLWLPVGFSASGGLGLVWMGIVEVQELVGGILQVCPVLLGVVFWSIASPPYEVV